jgi:hypothetical protein
MAPTPRMRCGRHKEGEPKVLRGPSGRDGQDNADAWRQPYRRTAC